MWRVFFMVCSLVFLQLAVLTPLVILFIVLWFKVEVTTWVFWALSPLNISMVALVFAVLALGCKPRSE